MKHQNDHTQLQRLARMCLDRDLANLRKSADAKEALYDRLADLEPRPATGFDPVTAARVAIMHQIWADARRAEINVSLARSIALWLEARSVASKSFGRWQVLSKLAPTRVK